MGHIRERKLKDGIRYQAEVRLKGHPTLTAGFDRKTDAKNWIQKVESDIRAGRHQLYSEGRKHTFKEAVARYCQEIKVPQTKECHLKWWTGQLGALYLQDIRPAIITEKKQKLLTEINSKGKTRTRSTVNRYLASLSHLLSVCSKQWEWISENPVKKVSREKEPRGRVRFLSPEERIRFLDACRESENPLLYLFVILLLSTGCRYSEIKYLKFTDVELHKGTITLKETKNGNIHSIPLRGLGLELLRKRYAESNSLGYVFPGKNNNSPMDPRRSIKTAIKKANLKDFSPHCCRHSFATEMLAQGISIGEVSQLLNHKNISVTMRYAHLVESRSIDAVSKMSEQIFKGMGNG